MNIDRIELLPLPDYDLTGSQQETLRRVFQWTKSFFDGVTPETHIGGHGLDKVMRQAGMAAAIAYREDHPIFLPVLTAMVMDVGRVTQDPRSRTNEHGTLSRELASPLFDSLGILTEEERVAVEDAIEDHPKMNDRVRRSYIVEVVMDADRLDCLGALGPLRAASWRPNIPIILPEETETTSGDTQILTMWQDMAIRHMEWFDMLWTNTAREIARPRVEFYRSYLAELQLEASFMYQAYRKLEL